MNTFLSVLFLKSVYVGNFVFGHIPQKYRWNLHVFNVISLFSASILFFYLPCPFKTLAIMSLHLFHNSRTLLCVLFLCASFSCFIKSFVALQNLLYIYILYPHNKQFLLHDIPCANYIVVDNFFIWNFSGCMFVSTRPTFVRNILLFLKMT